jgi:hypothetical protein
VDILEKIIIDLEEELRLIDASPEPDTSEALERLIADDALIVGPQGELYEKSFLVKAHKPPMKQNFDEVNVSEFEYRKLSETSVVTASRAEFKQGAKTFALRFVRVWQRAQGRNWQVVAGTVTAIHI